MKIATTTFGCDGGLSGIGRYTSTLLNLWIEAGIDLRIYGHNSERSAFVPQGKTVDWRPVTETWIKPLPNILWHQAMLPVVTKGADVVFLPAGNRRLPAFCSIPAVGTVHDCSSIHIAGKYDRKRDLYIKYVLPRLMQRLDRIATVSESTKEDLVNFCGVDPARIAVVPLAADGELFFPQDPDIAANRLLQRYAIRGPFLLYIARIEHPGKNHIRLISAFEQLKRNDRIPHKLVFVGPEKERASEVRRAAAASSCREDIEFVGTVPSQDLPILYSAADAFIFPSLYEGFGLPVLESMACGTPVSCSNRSSLPEVAGDAAVLFDPDDSGSIASSIRNLLGESNSDREKRIVAGHHRSSQFNWHRTANQTLELLQNLA